MCIWGWHTQFLNKFRLATTSVFLMSYHFASVYDAYHPSFQLKCKSLCRPYSKLWKLMFHRRKVMWVFYMKVNVNNNNNKKIIIKKPLLLNGFSSWRFRVSKRFREPFLLLYLPLLQSSAGHFNVHCHWSVSERCAETAYFRGFNSMLGRVTVTVQMKQ